ncbi:putative trihelix transcription factor GT-3b [Cocos nucifera]|nr:putative trihelix transcription factor GT-3b [Cocos nucifera]
MQRELLESESGASHSKKKLKKLGADKSSDELSEDDEDSDGERLTKTRKRKVDRGLQQRATDKSRATGSSIYDLLQDFLQQQQRMEVRWREMMERRTRERLVFEQEWRQSMEKLEKERLMLEQAWWEREEQRRMREEMRAEKRDALLTTLLNKFLREDL